MADRITLVLSLFSVFLYLIEAEDNKYFVMSPCSSSTLSLFSHFHKIDGAVIQKGDYRPGLDCTLKFRADGRFRRFMIHFESLQLTDCKEQLKIFDENYLPLADLNCKKQLSDMKSLVTRTDYLIIQYISGSSESKRSNFKIVLTAFKDPVLASKCDFRCHSGHCIDDDLVCDRVNHCGDNSDEQRCIDISDSAFKILGLGVSVFIVIMVCIFVLCSICIICFILCLCRKKTSQNNQNNISYQTTTTTATAPPLAPINMQYPRQPGYPYIPPNAYTYQPENPAAYPNPNCPFPQQRSVMYDVNQDQVFYK